MKVGVLIPTIRERQFFLEHSLHLLKLQSRVPDLIEVVDDPKIYSRPDTTWRYKIGIKRLISKGAELIIFWEDDDWYCNQYIEIIVDDWFANGKPQLFGYNETIYYHIVLRKLAILQHPGRASAMSTMITADAPIIFKDDLMRFFDMDLWKQNMRKIAIHPDRHLCIGIKHGLTPVTGGAHECTNGIYRTNDQNMSFLKSVMDEYSVKFYSGFYLPKNDSIPITVN